MNLDQLPWGSRPVFTPDQVDQVLLDAHQRRAIFLQSLCKFACIRYINFFSNVPQPNSYEMLCSLTGSEQGRINTNGLTTLCLLSCPRDITQFRDSPT